MGLLIEEDRADWYHYRICVSRQPSSRGRAGHPTGRCRKAVASGDDSSPHYTCSGPRRRRRMTRRNTSMNGRSRSRLPTRMGCPDTGGARWRSQCHHVSGRAHPRYDDGEANLGGERRTGKASGWRDRSTVAGWRENSRARQRGAYLAADLQNRQGALAFGCWFAGCCRTIDPFKRVRQVEGVPCFSDLTSASARKPASKSAPPLYAGFVAVCARRVHGFRGPQQLAGPATHATELAASVEAVSQAGLDEPPLHAREIESVNNPGRFFTEHNWG